MRAFALIFGLSACVVIPVPVPTFEAAQVRTLPVSSPRDAAFHAQLNSARSKPVTYNAQLAAVAQAHAADMNARGYFDHASPEGAVGGDRAAAAGIPACGIGENIGQGQANAAQVFTGWMTSGAHRRNMLNPRIASYGLGHAGDRWVLMLYAPC